MSTFAIAPVEAINLTPSPMVSLGTPVDASFSSLLIQGLSKVNQSLNAADATLQAVAVGEPIAPHQAILALEEAKMNLQLALQIRNKAVEGLQELMRMQI